MDFKTEKFLWITIILFSLLFFYKTIVFGLLPIPADALVGLYHPFRDYYSVNYPNGVPFKNYILTDPVLQQYPWKKLAMEQIGNILKGFSLKDPPLSKLLANPYSFSGFAAGSAQNIQAGILYPLNIIFMLINDFPLAWTAFIIIQPVLTALFMFWWLKNSGIQQLAAIFGGLVWAFSSFNLVWLEWGNIGHAGLYLPLALLAIDRLKVKSEKLKVRWKWHVILQAALASSLFAGHFQITFYLLAAVGLYWFIRLGISKRSFLLFIIHYSLFILITSPQWLPSLKFTLLSNRSVEQADVLSREGFFIRPRQLVQLIAPDFFGNPATLNYRGEWNYAEQIIYIGSIPLIFTCLGLFIKSSKNNHVDSLCYSMVNLHRFCLLLVVVGLLFAVKNPIAEIPFRLNIPMLKDLQPTRLSYLITFGLSVLSAIGLNEFIKYPRRLLPKVLAILAILAALLFMLLVISSKFSPDAKLVSQRNLIFPFITLGAVVLISVGFRIFPKKIYSLLFTSYFLLSILDLFRFGWKFTPFSPKEYLYPVTPSIKFLQENMKGNDRYMTLDRKLLPPNANIMYKLKSVEGYDPIYLKSYALKIAKLENNNQIIPNYGRIIRPSNFSSPEAKTLNVKYVLSLEDLDDEGLQKVFQESETRVYELTGD
ncbi:hypothetical protein HZB78_05340 [Candidatus Collierbacteria bacterium]|nr:hypothetical protein [Candidatus Collierbacteria bacterium]